jgi:hypothetical protein
MIRAYICRFVAYMAKGDFRYIYQGELTFGGIKVLKKNPVKVAQAP